MGLSWGISSEVLFFCAFLGGNFIPQYSRYTAEQKAPLAGASCWQCYLLQNGGKNAIIF